MKKTALILLIISLCLALTSCFGGNDDPPPPESDAVYGRIVYNGDIIDISALLSPELTSAVGRVSVVTDAEADEKLEIVVGSTNRQISHTAASILDSLFQTGTYDGGYVIYSHNGEVAIVWSNDAVRDEVIKAFLDNCIVNGEISVKPGVICSEMYNFAQAEKNEQWAEIEAKAGAEVAAALKALYEFYDDERIVDWVANLYDPQTGGFYYSNSARDYEPFRPDIESTNFAIGAMVSFGALKHKNDLPDSIKQKIVEYAKGLQSPTDGYFYHPQWPQGKENLNTDRYGRDLVTGDEIIKLFTYDADGDGIADRMYPNYCIPGGSKCEKHSVSGGRCSFPASASAVLTLPLGESAASAVSKVVPTASSHPDYSSAEAFLGWLEEYNAGVKNNSGNAHQIAELRYEIIDKGYGEVLLDYLDRIQAEIYDEQVARGETPSGVWQYTADYRAVWGLLKYMALYNESRIGRRIDIKYVPYIVDTCVKVISMPPDGGYAMNDLMNQWRGIERIITNVRKYYGDAEVEKIYARVRENAVALIENTVAKIAPFKLEDGSVAYKSNGISMTTIYGVPISSGVREGDLNALVCAYGLYSSVFACMGYTAVKPFDSSDGERFVELITSMKPVEKEKPPVLTVDFEDEDIGAAPSGASLSKNTAEGLIEVREDPTDPSNKALYFASGVAAAMADTLKLGVSNHGTGCYIFETDMYVDPSTDDGYIFQIWMGDAYLLAMYKSGGTLTLKAAPSTNHGGGQQDIFTCEVGKWFKFRIEYFPEAVGTAPRAKAWLNGEFCGENALYSGSDTGAVPKVGYAHIKFYSMRLCNTHIYLDNYYAAEESKAYVKDDPAISDLRGTK